MAFLKATAPRTFIKMNPYEDRVPVFSDQIYYYTGSLIAEAVVDSDSIYYDYYIANHDVGVSNISPSNSSEWSKVYSTNPAVAALFTDSDLRAYVDDLRTDYTKHFGEIDSDIQATLDAFGNVTGYDSDINNLYMKDSDLTNRKIHTLVDSNVSHNKTIVWDSDLEQYLYATPGLTLNGVGPDSTGNLSFTFSKTLTGTRDEKPDSDTDGTIFVVVRDSDSDVDGISFIYNQASGWSRLIGFTDLENENKFVNLSGDTMSGPLKLKNSPQTDSEVATKKYVDDLNDSDKQDKIIILDTMANLLSYSYEEDRIYFVKENNTIWIYLDGALRQFTIPRQRTQDPVLLEAKATNIAAASFDVELKTYRFSSVLPGTLRCVRDGSVPNFILIMSDITGVSELDGSISNAKLLDGNVQQFKIRITETYQPTSKYVISFVSHDGVVTSIEIDGTNNEVVFSENNRSFNFGEY